MQPTCVVGFSRFLEIGVPDICDSPNTKERNHPSGVFAAGKVWGFGDIAGHRPPMGGGLLALHIHDRVERFLEVCGASHVFMGTWWCRRKVGYTSTAAWAGAAQDSQTQNCHQMGTVEQYTHLTTLNYVRVVLDAIYQTLSSKT